MSLTATSVTTAVILAALAPLAAVRAQDPPPAPAQPAAARPVTPEMAREKAPEATASSGDKLTAYYAIPEIPATTFLNASPSKITRPMTPKDFVASLLEGLDESGRVRRGIAIEASLGLSRGFVVPLATYQQSPWARLRSNLLFSLAAAQASGDTSSTEVAWGVRAPIYDAGDPLADTAYTDRLGAAMLACAPDQPVDVPRNIGQSEAELRRERERLQPVFDARRTESLACLENVAGELGKAAADSNWNVTRLVVAYAGGMRLAQSKFDDRRRIGDRVWAVGSIPLARMVQGIGYLDYSRQRRVDTIPSYSTWTYGGRINVGRATLNAFYELLGERRANPPPNVKGRSSAWSGGIEFLATEGLWISTGFGKRAQEVFKPDKTVLIANIRWGFSSKPFASPIGTSR